MTTINGFFQQFVQYSPDGKFDAKKTTKVFEAAAQQWIQAQADIKPAIMAELAEYKRLGEQLLINYTLHRLHLPSTGDNMEMVKEAIGQLSDAGSIQYQTNEKGTRRGRNAGWVLASRGPVVSTTSARGAAE